jgi:hypothetical protein
MREDMFDEQRMAGGGIVAFERGGDVKEMTAEERAEYIKNNPYLQRSQAIANIPAGFADFIREYNPVTGSKYRQGLASFFSEPANIQAEKFRGNKPYSYQATPEDKAIYQQEVALAKANDVPLSKQYENFDKATALFEKERPIVLDEKKTAPAGNVTTKTAKKDDKKAPASPLEDLFTRQEKLIEAEREASKAARDEAKWMRLAEAGLGIAGGESPYALSNLKGAIPALRGYGEDISGLRKEERQRTKDLMEIQKERADMDYKTKLLRVQELAATKPSSFAELVNLYKIDPELARKVQGAGKAGVMTFEEAYKVIAIDPKNMALNEVEKAQKARELMNLSTLGGGVQAQLPPGIPANSVQIGTSKGKPVYKAPDGKQYIVS